LWWIALSSCAASPPAAHRFEGDGFAVTFPAEHRARDAHEGPLARAQIVTATDAEGCVHEAAVFTMPAPLEAPARARLLDRVERALSALPHVREARSRALELHGMQAFELDARLEDDRSGRWQVFYASPERMVQLSVVGPSDAPVDRRADAFFASFSLEAVPSR
jgi:hypothetical protein